MSETEAWIAYDEWLKSRSIVDPDQVTGSLFDDPDETQDDQTNTRVTLIEPLWITGSK